MIPIDFDNINLSDVQATSPEVPKRALLKRLGTTNEFVLEIDNTTMNYFQTCPRSAFLYTVKRKQRPDRAPLIFGGAIHAALEILYRHGFDYTRAAKQAALDYFECHPYNTTGQWRTPAYAIEAIDNYVKYWSLMDNLTPLSQDWVEKAFSLNIGHVVVNAALPYTLRELTDEPSDEPLYATIIHIQWCGKIDILAHNGGPDSGLWVVDHKTSSMGGDTFYADFELGQQTHGYQWASEHILGQPVNGFILNALIIRQPTRTGKGMEFDRKMYPYTRESLLEWKSDMLMSVENYIHALTSGAFPKYTAWCMGKYGRCQYHTVCTLPSAQRQFMLDAATEYENVTWSPLHDTTNIAADNIEPTQPCLNSSLTNNPTGGSL